MVRWNTLAGELKMAVSDNGELMALSGFINPYPGRLGVVEEGTVADLVLVDGNPLGNIKLMKGRVQSRLSHVPTVRLRRLSIKKRPPDVRNTRLLSNHES